MAMPTDVPIIDCMISFPIADKKAMYEFITKQTKDTQSKEEYKFPVEYMFKDVPDEADSSEDPVAVTLREMDKHNIEKGLIGIGSENSQRALKEHPDRFVAALSVDPNDIMGALEKIVEGRLGKFYEEICLLEQPFIRDTNISVGQWLASQSAQAGAVTVKRFVRYKVGEGVTA